MRADRNITDDEVVSLKIRKIRGIIPAKRAIILHADVRIIQAARILVARFVAIGI